MIFLHRCVELNIHSSTILISSLNHTLIKAILAGPIQAELGSSGNVVLVDETIFGEHCTHFFSCMQDMHIYGNALELICKNVYLGAIHAFN